MRTLRGLRVGGAAVAIAAVVAAGSARLFAQDMPPPEEAADPAEVAIGERLFLETRFAQFFFANSRGNPNATLAEGDPVMDTTSTTGEPSPAPSPAHR